MEALIALALKDLGITMMGIGLFFMAPLGIVIAEFTRYTRWEKSGHDWMMRCAGAALCLWFGGIGAHCVLGLFA